MHLKLQDEDADQWKRMNSDIEKLKHENQQLRHQLETMMQHARLNEEKLQRFSEMELLLIGTHSLRDLLQIIINNYRNTFELDAVSLILIDTDYELLRFLDETGLQLDQLPELQLEPDASVVNQWFEEKVSPILLAYSDDYSGLFQHPLSSDKKQSSHRSCLESIAILPLMRNGQLIGSLNLGSCDASRFHAEVSTDFLQRLAAIVSICIENSINVTRLERVGLTDPLTAVYNRRFFEKRLHEVVSSSVRYNFKLSCLFIDVDHFKKVNDVHGHQVGDLVLQEVAGIIGQHLRGSDMVARYGGEEFIVLLPQTPLDQAAVVAERIRMSLQQHRFYLSGGETLSITVSAGVAGMQTQDMSREAIELGQELVKQADLALLSAKSSGRNKIEVAGMISTEELDTII